MRAAFAPRTRSQPRQVLYRGCAADQRSSGRGQRQGVPGHWEGDLILGLGSSAIGSLVERQTRFTLFLHLPRIELYGKDKAVKNGTALAEHGAETVPDAIAGTIMDLPAHLRRIP